MKLHANHAARPTKHARPMKHVRPSKYAASAMALEALEPRLLLDTTSYGFSVEGPQAVYNGHDLYLEVHLNNFATDGGDSDNIAAKFDEVVLYGGGATSHITAVASDRYDVNFLDADGYLTTVTSTYDTAIRPGEWQPAFSAGANMTWIYRPSVNDASYFVVRVHTDGDASLNGHDYVLRWKSTTYAVNGSGGETSSLLYKDYTDGNTYTFHVDAAPSAPNPTFDAASNPASSSDFSTTLPTWEKDMVEVGRQLQNPAGTDNSWVAGAPSICGPRQPTSITLGVDNAYQNDSYVLPTSATTLRLTLYNANANTAAAGGYGENVQMDWYDSLDFVGGVKVLTGSNFDVKTVITRPEVASHSSVNIDIPLSVFTKNGKTFGDANDALASLTLVDMFRNSGVGSDLHLTSVKFLSSDVILDNTFDDMTSNVTQWDTDAMLWNLSDSTLVPGSPGYMYGPSSDADDAYTLGSTNSSYATHFADWMYDGVENMYRIMDYTGSTALQTGIESTLATYRDHYVNVGVGMGYFDFPTGLLSDYLRTGDTESLASLTRLATDWTYNNSMGDNGTGTERETAFALNAALDYKAAGGDPGIRIKQGVDLLLGHIDRVLRYDIDYSGLDHTWDEQPYMISLEVDALLRYFRQEAPTDYAILDEIKKVGTWIWDNFYIPRVQPDAPNTDYFKSMQLCRTQPAYAYLGTKDTSLFTRDANLESFTHSGAQGGSTVRVKTGQTSGVATYVISGLPDQGTRPNCYDLVLDYYETTGATATVQIWKDLDGNDTMTGSEASYGGTLNLNGATAGFLKTQVRLNTLGLGLANGDTVKMNLTASGSSGGDRCEIDRVVFVPSGANDMSLMVASIYGELYNYYGSADLGGTYPDAYDTWYEMGDILFKNGGAGFSWETGKTYNEHYTYSIDYVQFRQNHDFTGDAIATPQIHSVTTTPTSVAKAGTLEWDPIQAAGSPDDFITISSGYDPADRDPAMIVSWTTTVPSTTQLNYGTTSGSYPNVVQPGIAGQHGLKDDYAADRLTTSHSLTLKGLTAGQTYHFQIRAVNAEGDVSTTAVDQFFTMPAVNDATAPTIMSPKISGSSNAHYVFACQTNDDADLFFAMYPNGAAADTIPADYSKYTPVNSVGSWYNDLAGRNYEKSLYGPDLQDGERAVPILTNNATYYVQIVSEDRQGNRTVSPNLYFKYVLSGQDSSAPTASITSPTGGANLSGNVTVTANVSDNIGVWNTVFWLDGTTQATGHYLGETLGGGTVSITFNADKYATGSHTIYAVAYDHSSFTTAPNYTTAQVAVTFGSATLASIAQTSDGSEQALDTAVFRVTLDTAAPAGGTTVNYAIGGTTGHNDGSDYNTLSGSVLVQSGQTTATITVTPVDDGFIEGTETVQLTVTSGTGYTVGSPSVATANIVDNETGIVLDNTFNDVNMDVLQYDHGAFAWLTPFSNETLVTGSPGYVYGSRTSSGNFTMNYGSSYPLQNDSYQLTQDVSYLRFILKNVGATQSNAYSGISLHASWYDSTDFTGGAINTGRHTYIAINNIPRPAIAAGTTYNLDIALSELVDGGDNFGQTGDAIGYLNLSNLFYSTGLANDADLRLIGVEFVTAPVASIARTSDGSEAGLSPAVFTVTLDPAPAVDTTVNYTVTGGTATSGTDYTAPSGSVIIAQGATTATISIAPLQDTAKELTESVIVTVASGTGYTVGTQSAATVNITDNDTLAMNTGLVGLWRMDENIGTTANDTDMDGVADTGTLTNGPTWVAGKVGKAVQFDGSNDYILVPSSTDLNISGTHLTLACWAKSDNASWNQSNAFISHRNGYMFGGVSGTKEITMSLYNGGTGTSARYTPASIDITQWHLYVATFDGTYMKLYIDGAEITAARTSWPYSITSGAVETDIGRDNYAGRYLDGAIDEARVFNTTLDATAITAMYNRESGGGLSVTNLTIDSANSGYYSIQSYALATGINQYGDVGDTFTTVPSKYLGSTFIRTAKADKASTAWDLVKFTFSQDVILYVAYDDAITSKPAWLTTDFTDTGDNIVTSDSSRTFSVYKTIVTAGTVTLGANLGDATKGMYSVFFQTLS